MRRQTQQTLIKQILRRQLSAAITVMIQDVQKESINAVSENVSDLRSANLPARPLGHRIPLFLALNSEHG